MNWSLGACPRKTVHYCTFKSPSIKAMAYHGEVYVSIDIDTEDITSALYEEYTHIETSYGDCSRSLQTHLFKEVIKLNRLIIGPETKRFIAVLKTEDFFLEKRKKKKREKKRKRGFTKIKK